MNLDSDDFELFGVPRRFAQDRAELDARWRALQAEVHPDRFAAEGGAAQRAAVQWAVRVNEAYQRLKDPLTPRRLPVRAARRPDQRREQHGHAGRLPDAADGMARGARRRRRTVVRSRRWRSRSRHANAQALAEVAALDRRASTTGPPPRSRSEPSCSSSALPRTSIGGSKRWDNDAMALLQISEPGGAPDPHQRRIAVGIDLGTTHSLVAAVRNGVAECLPDDAGRVILPSAVRYLAERPAPDRRGSARRGAIDPRNTIVSVKRFMGRGLADIAERGKLPYDFVDAPGMVQAAHGGRRKVAGRGVGRDPRDAAPARGGHLRRRPVRRRHHRAGLLRRRPAPGDQGRGAAGRPERAAPDQRADRRGDRLWPGARLGRPVRGLRPGRRHLRHLAAAPDRRACSRWSPPAATRRSAATTSTRCSPTGRSRRRTCRPSRRQDQRAVLVAARAAKEKLSATDHVTLACPLGAGELSVRVTREELETLVEPLIARTLAAVRKVLRDAKVAKTEVQGVVMVGGSTRMPRIQAAVGEFFGQHAADQPEPRRGRRARRRDPGQRARRQRRRGRTAAARRDSAVARPRDHGRPGRAHHPAQQHHPDRAGAGLHDLQGRPDRDGDPRGAGRARTGVGLPLAGALRAARHSADGRPARRASA